VTREGFREWVEVASREATCGWIFPLDLWVAPDGLVHLLWSERAIDERLRARFFPQARQSHALNHAVIRAGKVIRREAVAEVREGEKGAIPSFGRFHVTPDHRLYVVFFVQGTDASGKNIAEDRLTVLGSEGQWGRPVTVPLQHPMGQFFTATIRAGSAPSRTLDLLGHRVDRGNGIAYARLRIE
jgi:hypothetical protein